MDAHRPLGATEELDSILSDVENRQLTNNYTVSWDGKFFQIAREAVRPGLRSSWVRVEGRLDGTVWARIANAAVAMKRCAQPLPEATIKPAAEPCKDHNRGGRSQWMKNFDLSESVPNWVAATRAG